MPLLVIDGREITWEEFGRMLMAFEGWQFKTDVSLTQMDAQTVDARYRDLQKDHVFLVEVHLFDHGAKVDARLGDREMAYHRRFLFPGHETSSSRLCKKKLINTHEY